MAGALTLEAVFRLLRQLELATTWQPTVQGVIIVAAVAYASWRPSLRLPSRHPEPTTQGSPRPTGGE
jgi:ribose transport system permease protein